MRLGVIVNNKYAPLKHFVYVLTFPYPSVPAAAAAVAEPEASRARVHVAQSSLAATYFVFQLPADINSVRPTMTDLQTPCSKNAFSKQAVPLFHLLPSAVAVFLLQLQAH